MAHYAVTRRVNGDVLELDVFRTSRDRDEWVAEGADVETACEDNDWECGPRGAVDAWCARATFRDGYNGGYDWVRLHSGVRDRGMRLPSGTVHGPRWLDLTTFAEQPNGGNGIDWTRDVTFCRR